MDTKDLRGGRGILAVVALVVITVGLFTALFDLNDHFTHEQAGAADPGLEYFYPIKALAEMDNACRMPVGFQPTGEEPGLCPALAPPKPGEPGSAGCQSPTQGCGRGQYWSADICACNTFQ